METYHFESLLQMAQFMETKAKLARDNASTKKRGGLKHASYISEAAAWESAAHLVRRAKIDPPDRSISEVLGVEK